MKQLSLSFLMPLLLVLASCAPTASVVQTVSLPSYTGPKAKLVVSQFTCETSSCGAGGAQVGSGMSDALLTALVQSGRYDVFESAQTVGLLEQELDVTGSDAAFSAADLVVIGAVTDFNPSASGIGSGLSVPVPFFGSVGGSASKSSAAMDLRVIDVRTRQVVAVSKVKGEASGFDANAKGYFKGFGGNLGGYSNTSMETAIATMINAAVVDLIGKIPAEYYGRPPTAQASTGASQTPTETSAETSDGGSGSLSSSIKLLPNNEFPFEDDFESFSLGQVVAEASPQSYGIFRTDGSDDGSFAKIEETFNADGQSSKTIQLSSSRAVAVSPNEAYITFGAENSTNYKASFDFKTNTNWRSTLELQLNIGQGGTKRFDVKISLTDAWVTLDKVLGSQRVQLLNRDNLGFQFADNSYHQAEVISQSGMIQVKIDGRMLIEYQDQAADYAQGGLGLGVQSDKAAPIFIDNLVISNL